MTKNKKLPWLGCGCTGRFHPHNVRCIMRRHGRPPSRFCSLRCMLLCFYRCSVCQIERGMPCFFSPAVHTHLCRRWTSGGELHGKSATYIVCSPRGSGSGSMVVNRRNSISKGLDPRHTKSTGGSGDVRLLFRRVFHLLQQLYIAVPFRRMNIHGGACSHHGLFSIFDKRARK